MMSDYRLSLVFCAVDESDLLEDSFNKTFYNDSVCECLFVLSQNCSSACLETVKRFCSNEKCRYIFQTGFGLGNAIRSAFDEVCGTHIIFWPADDGMDDAALPKMIELSKENSDKIVTVSRWKRKGDFSNYGKIRKIINFISQRFFSLLFNSELTDFTNPTQIAPIDVYRQIRWEHEGFEFIPEMIFKPLKIGVQFIEVPCKNIERRTDKSHSGFLSLVKYYFVILKIRFMPQKSIYVRSKQTSDKMSETK
ncbi:MAG: glycosyltransferase [Acutalibacteraceae bacterium]